MARPAINTPFLEDWIRSNCSCISAGSNGHRPPAISARSIIQAWSELRESFQNHTFNANHLKALKTLLGSEKTLHVADPQAKLLVSILSSQDLTLPLDSYPLFLRLLYIWIRKSFRPSLALVDSAVKVICHVFCTESEFTPSFIAQGVLVSGACMYVSAISENSKSACLDMICQLLENHYKSIGLQEELVLEVLSGIGYALSSSSPSPNVNYVRLLDSLFGIWEKEAGPRGNVSHGLMILHLIDWVISGCIKLNNDENIMLFVKEVLETSKANYAVFATIMAAAGVLRASSRTLTARQGFEIVFRLRKAAEKHLRSEAENSVSISRRPFCDSPKDPSKTLLQNCFALALARSGPVSFSHSLLLCLVSSLLTEIFPLGHIYKSIHGNLDGICFGGGINWVKDHLSSIPFREAGAITGAFCNLYVSSDEEGKCIVENLLWDFCQDLYLNHRQTAFLLRGSEDELLGDIEKIVQSCFLMLVVVALAVTKKMMNSETDQEKRMETSVKILVSFSCVEYFRNVRLPEYMETIRGVIVSVQENDSSCVSFVESIPSYNDLTDPKDSFRQNIKYAWSRDEVQTARILFYFRVMPTCIGRIPASVFREVVAPTMFLCMGHPNGKVARASHSLFVAFVSSSKGSEEVERIQLKEHLVFYYMQRSLEEYPGITPFEGMASGVAALVRHIPAGSPVIYYTINCLVEKASTLCREAETDVWKNGDGKPEPCKELLELLLRLISLVDVQVLPTLMKSLAQLVVGLPKEGQNIVLDELYEQVSESDDVIRKPALVSWLQSLTYICSRHGDKDSKSCISKRNGLDSRL